MNFVSTESSCSVVWWGARAACAEVSTGSVEASKARLRFRPQKVQEVYGRLVLGTLQMPSIVGSLRLYKVEQALF
jgi:hypothetical protein